MQSLKNRWLIAASAVGIHISIGSVYAYSVIINPINELLGWNKSDIASAFCLAILVLGITAAFFGCWVERKGPRWSGRLAACCYGLGIAGSGFAIESANLSLFMLCYGGLGGIGLGIGYITPVSTLVKWFPYQRGFATGIAIMGFGFSALIFSPLMSLLFEYIGLPHTFYLLGITYFTLMFCSASYLEVPPSYWIARRPVSQGRQNLFIPRKVEVIAQLTAKEAIRTLRFYLIWVMFFINLTCGLSLISVASPMAQDIAQMTAIQAASMVGIMGLFNGSGRLLWACCSDVIGRPVTYSLFFIIQIIAFIMLAQKPGPLVFQSLIFCIVLCYGGGFASLPAYLSDMFGTKELSTIHGYLLTAWAAAGFIGPVILSRVKETTGSYTACLHLYSVFLVIALAISILIKRNIDKLRFSRTGIHHTTHIRE